MIHISSYSVGYLFLSFLNFATGNLLISFFDSPSCSGIRWPAKSWINCIKPPGPPSIMTCRLYVCCRCSCCCRRCSCCYIPRGGSNEFINISIIEKGSPCLLTPKLGCMRGFINSSSSIGMCSRRIYLWRSCYCWLAGQTNICCSINDLGNFPLHFVHYY